MARSRPLQRHRLAAAGASAWLGWFPVTAAAAADEVAFTINDSGSPSRPGWPATWRPDGYWTVNDSGDGGVAYGLSPTARSAGTLNYRAAAARRRGGRGPRGPALRGRHRRQRRASATSSRVYYFDNPRASGLTVAYRAWDFRYPDGPHDAETLLVNDKGRLFIVTKGAEGGGLRRPAEPEPRRVNELRGSARPRRWSPTAPSCPAARIALLTYGSVEVVDAEHVPRRGQRRRSRRSAAGVADREPGRASRCWWAARARSPRSTPSRSRGTQTATPSPTPTERPRRPRSGTTCPRRRARRPPAGAGPAPCSPSAWPARGVVAGGVVALVRKP